MVKKFTKGDEVEWSSHGGTASGEVEKEITERTQAAGRTVAASEDDPQYLVRSEKSGGEAVHKPSALRKKSRPSRQPRRGVRPVHGRRQHDQVRAAR